MRKAAVLLVVLVALAVVATHGWRSHSAPAADAQAAPVITPDTVAGLRPAESAQAIQASPTAMPQAQAAEMPVIHEPNTPAFHDAAPASLPPTLNPSQFSDPRVKAAYDMAAQVRPVLYQQPCYCHCDQEIGHHCLLDCFTGDHASICETCMQEGVYAYRQTKLGKTPGQIRAGIKNGEWKTVRLNDLAQPR